MNAMRIFVICIFAFCSLKMTYADSNNNFSLSPNSIFQKSSAIEDENRIVDFKNLSKTFFLLHDASVALIKQCKNPVIANKINQELFNNVVISSIQYLDMLYKNIFMDSKKSIGWPFGYLDANQFNSLKKLAASQIQLYIYLIRIQVSNISNWNYEESFPVVKTYLKIIKKNLLAIEDLNNLLFYDNNFDVSSLFLSIKTIGDILSANKMTSKDMKELDDKIYNLTKDIESFYMKIFSSSDIESIIDDQDLKNQFWHDAERRFNKKNPSKSLAELSIRFKLAKNRLDTYDVIYNPSRNFFKNFRILINHLSDVIQKEVLETYLSIIHYDFNKSQIPKRNVMDSSA